MDPHSFIARAEAQRWLGIAEKLLISHDLVGSKTFAIRARESDPRLEAAEQILAIADTLLAAEKRVVGNNGAHQPDFYAILQLVRFVQDTEHIASQYRRLAVLLNPHQNRFPYSDQAFQLVNDAWAVLSNPMRKSMYDSDLDYPPQQQMNSLGFNLEQQHHQQQQQPHNFFSINHMGAGHEQELPEQQQQQQQQHQQQQQTFQSRLHQSHQQQHQQLQQHNFLSQPNPVRPLPVREQEHMFREQDHLFQPQVQPFQVTSPPHQQNRPSPQPHIQSPPATPQSPFSWPQAPQLSQPQQQKSQQSQFQQQLQHQQMKQEQQQHHHQHQHQIKQEQQQHHHQHEQQLQQQMKQEQLKQEQLKQQQLQQEQLKQQQLQQEQLKQQQILQMQEEQRKQQQLQQEQQLKQQQLQQEQLKQQQLLEEQRKQQQLLEEQRKQQQLQEEQRKQQQLQEEQRKQQQLLEEQRKQQQLLEEQRKQQQLQEEQRKQQQLLEEQRKQQQILEEQQRQQQLQEEQRKQQQLQEEQRKQQEEALKQNAAPAQFPNQINNNNNGVREEETETETEAETEDMDDSPTFWTACPYCFYMYEYPKVYVECTLRCDNCKRAFQAVRISSPPPIIEGQDACFYCWGFFPLGLSMSHLQNNNNNKGTSSNWTPFSSLHTASNNAQNHLNEQAAPKENLFVNKSLGPRIYIDDITDDVFIGVSDPSSDSDMEWKGTKKQKLKRMDKGFKERIQVLALRAMYTSNGSVKNLKHGIPVKEGVELPAVLVVETNKKYVGNNPRKKSGRVAPEMGKLDLNVEFNNNEGEENAPRLAAGTRVHEQGEEDDNIEGIEFFEGLDEYLSSLPILSVVNEEKVKVA